MQVQTASNKPGYTRTPLKKHGGVRGKEEGEAAGGLRGNPGRRPCGSGRDEAEATEGKGRPQVRPDVNDEAAAVVQVKVQVVRLPAIHYNKQVGPQSARHPRSPKRQP